MTTQPGRKKRQSAAVKVAADLRERIEAGRLAPGEALPSTRHLVDQYEVSEGSIYAAVTLLKASGHVVSQQGKNVRVADRSSLISGAERIGGITRPGEEIQWRHTIRTEAPDWVAGHIGEGECVERARLVRRGSQIREASRSWVHLDAVEVVPELDEAAPCDPTWQALYRERTGVDVVNTGLAADARIATAEDKAALELAEDGTYALLIVRNVYAVEATTISVGEIVCAPGRPVDLKKS